ncbi:hypothetical protein EAF04_005124 [Stromatinia cepivora]|nr:hypothetical protein EAF04_005124 [Stromatinia cepivora]
MDTQKGGATTDSTPSKITKGAKEKTTPCCDRFKTPSPKFMASPPRAPHPRRVLRPEERQKTEPPSPTPDGSRRNYHNRDSTMASHNLEEMVSNYHDINRQYWKLIDGAHLRHDETRENESMPGIQSHGTSTTPASIIAQQRGHITSNGTNASDSEEPFCQVSKAERSEEASFW